MTRESAVALIAHLLLDSSPDAPSDEAFTAFPRAVAAAFHGSGAKFDSQAFFSDAVDAMLELLIYRVNRVRLRAKLFTFSSLSPPQSLTREHREAAVRHAKIIWSKLRKAGVVAPG